MKKRYWKIIITCLVLLLSLSSASANKKDQIVNETIPKYDFMTRYFKDDNLKIRKMVIVMSFMENPGKYFKKVKKIDKLFTYFSLLDRLSALEIYFKEYFFDSFVKKNFSSDKTNMSKIKILTYLSLHSDGYFGEILSDRYCKLFAVDCTLFLKYLKVHPKWKNIVNFLDPGDWQIFSEAVSKLKDTGFEGEFKRYVFAPRDENGNRKKEDL